VGKSNQIRLLRWSPLFYSPVDARKWSRSHQRFVSIGGNALIGYLGARLIPFSPMTTYLVGGGLANFLNRRIADGPCAVAGVSLLLLFLCARFLNER